MKPKYNKKAYEMIQSRENDGINAPTSQADLRRIKTAKSRDTGRMLHLVSLLEVSEE